MLAKGNELLNILIFGTKDHQSIADSRIFVNSSRKTFGCISPENEE